MTEERKEQFKTLVILSVGLALIGWRWHHVYVAITALGLLIAGSLSSWLLKVITDGWLWIGEMIGAVMSRVVLSLVFFMVLTPVAVIYRLFGRKKRQLNPDSYYVERNHRYVAKDLEKVF